MKILIAEDDATTRTLLARTLESMGHEVIVAEDGKQAWEIFQNSPVFVVITDWEMPNMSGIELCHNIRNFPYNQYSFVILLTAKEGIESYQVALEAGVDDFLSKPFNKSDIEGRLRSASRVTDLEQQVSEQYDELQKALAHIQSDLDAAAKIQDSLLPHGIKSAGHLDIDWCLEPCEQLAGDIFNVVELSEDVTGIYLLDVSGHGVASALLSVSLSRLLSPYGEESFLMKQSGVGRIPVKPSEVLKKLNARFQISESSGNQYFTIFYALYDQRTHELTYSIAGNPPMLISNTNRTLQEFQQEAFPIGFVPDAEYQDEKVLLQEGDLVCLFSDGVYEILNDQMEPFGIERIKTELKKCSGEGLEKIIPQLIHAAKSWNSMEPLRDDISIMLFRVES